MKLSINRNTIWCDLFVQQLAKLGVRYGCISPGSRNTPLILSLAENKEIETFPIVDERSSAFFALGLAKKSNTPVVIVTTSGTAVAELYPAIIEAYYQRVPLIICTADRPAALQNSGANQTINQKNIYANHIRFFADAGLPNIKKLKSVIAMAENAVNVSSLTDRGPVHINFPFEKPFEPKSYTDKISIGKIDNLFSKKSFRLKPNKQLKIDFNKLSQKFRNKERGLILVGYNNYGNDFSKELINFSKTFGYPVFADGATSLRFNVKNRKHIIDNFTAFIRTEDFQKEFDPDVIIQFGGAPTSNVVLEYFKNSKAEKIIVNEYGDKNDPSLTAETYLSFNPTRFCNSLTSKSLNFKRGKTKWKDEFERMNSISAGIKNKLIENASFPFEGRIISEIINSLPENSNLMISNSLPIRDADFFVSTSKKKIKIFTNRGASGIDGINSTALGIAEASKEQTYLLVGDLAFFHDLNGLHNSIKYKIPLTVILVDNSGGGIFESLPIASYKEFLNDNFITPLKIDFKCIIEAYGGNYLLINSWRDLNRKLLSSVGNKRLSVLHIKTNAPKSKLVRQNYWARTAQEIFKYINEIRYRRNRV